MQVIATAGHVDHGKSTLARVLTGMEPDRWGEEKRRGLTIDLGFVWTTLPNGQRIALVDVPGHERFVGNMLAGLAPVPALLFVVAANEGWQAQSSEHLDAVNALEVHHALLVITKSDLADPDPARRAALERLSKTSLRAVRSVAVSARTGDGLDALRHELCVLTERLPDPDRDADVRLWVDRSFTVNGAGTVITGTLAAGALRVGDELLTASDQRFGVRGLQALGHETSEVAAVARVAVNLRGARRSDVPRGTPLLTPGAWHLTNQVDVHLTQPGWRLGQATFHVGSAAVPVRVRPLATEYVRLTLRSPLPLRVGDRAILRDPSRHLIIGIQVLDVRPAELRRRGAARSTARELDVIRADPTRLGATVQLRRHGFLLAATLRAMGLIAAGDSIGGGWLVDRGRWATLAGQARVEVATWAHDRPLTPHMPVDVLRQRLGIPIPIPIADLLRVARLQLLGGTVVDPTLVGSLPAAVEGALEVLTRRLARSPFQAPTDQELKALGLPIAATAAAVRDGRLVQLADSVILLPDALDRAAKILSALDPPFTVSQARIALGTTRRVAIPVLEALDQLGVTQRQPDNTRILGGCNRFGSPLVDEG